MGLMPLDEARWFELGAELAPHLAEKRALLAARHGEAFAALPDTETPASELLALVAAHLPLHHPGSFRRADAHLVNFATGETWDVARPALHPLDLCGRLVPEDFCLLLRQSDRPVLVGASLCAPARWRLAEKLGRPLGAVHAHVPGYDATLERPVDRFFAQLRPGKLVWRLNWGIVDDPARFQPVRIDGTAPIEAATAGEHLWLRVERQTLRKLPVSEAVVFTIRTHITRLDRAVTTPETARGLGSALASMPEEMQRYKNIAPFAPALAAWLAARS